MDLVNKQMDDFDMFGDVTEASETAESIIQK
jgi:hypothetical protein